MRIVDILYSLPSIVFVIVLITTLEAYVKRWVVSWARTHAHGPDALLFAGLGAVSWLTMARRRGRVLTLRTRPFVLAASPSGQTTSGYSFVIPCPTSSGIVIVYVTLTVPAIILYSFLPATWAWASNPGRQPWHPHCRRRRAESIRCWVFWWLIVCPGAVLAATLLALNFLRDSLQGRPRSARTLTCSGAALFRDGEIVELDRRPGEGHAPHRRLPAG